MPSMNERYIYILQVLVDDIYIYIYTYILPMPSHVGHILSFTYMEVHSRVLWLLRARGCKQLLVMNIDGQPMGIPRKWSTNAGFPICIIYIYIYMCESYIYMLYIYIYVSYVIYVLYIHICYLYDIYVIVYNIYIMYIYIYICMFCICYI